MDDRQILLEALKFHGHKCWASVAGVRAGLAALRTLGVKRSGGTQLYGIVETGEDHSGMCFGDGVQYTTGCTFGKGNIRKQPYGKLAFTLIDKDTNRAVRVSYKPTLKKQIADSAFMQKRAAGIMPDEIPEEEQMELVNLVWDAPESDVLTIGEVFDYPGIYVTDGAAVPSSLAVNSSLTILANAERIADHLLKKLRANKNKLIADKK